MNVEFRSANKVRLRLGLTEPSLNEILELIDLPAFGEEERQPAARTRPEAQRLMRRVRVATTIASKRDLWDAIGDEGWKVEGEDGLRRYRRLRSLLADSDEPHPREAVIGVARMFKKPPTVRVVYGKLGGSWKTMDGVMAIVDAQFGVKERKKTRARIARDLPMTELLVRYPIFAGLEGTSQDPEFPSSSEPPAKLLGRTDTMLSADLRNLLTLALLACPGRLADITVERCVRLLEALDEVAGEDEPALGAALIDRLSLLLVDNRLKLSNTHRETLLDHYKWMADALRDWHDSIPAARRPVFVHLIPPPVPPSLAQRLAILLKDIPEERAERRGKTAKPISLNREPILRVAELRFRQLDRLTRKVAAKCREIEVRLARGEDVQFPVTVQDTYHVVRAGTGGQGVGRQTTHVLIETSARLWEQCAQAEECAGIPTQDCRAWHWIDASRRNRIRPSKRGGERISDGTAWSPRLAGELRVIYAGTVAEKPGGECVEPFWLDIVRSRFFDSDYALTSEERAERAAIILLVGADPEVIHVPGLLDDSSRGGKGLARAYSRLVSQTRCIVHLRELHHAMAIGRAILRAELLRGLRIGESSQARSDPGAFSFRKFDGKLYFYLRVVPKLGRGRYRRMVIDEVTLGAFERVRVLDVERFYPDQGDVPERPFHDADRKDVLPGRYLFCTAKRVLTNIEMNVFLRLLTIGIVSSASHSYKSGFAAMIKTAKASGPVLNRSLNHAVGSPVSEGYARWAQAHMVDAFIAEEQQVSRKRQLDWALLE